MEIHRSTLAGDHYQSAALLRGSMGRQVLYRMRAARCRPSVYLIDVRRRVDKAGKGIRQGLQSRHMILT